MLKMQHIQSALRVVTGKLSNLPGSLANMFGLGLIEVEHGRALLTARMTKAVIVEKPVTKGTTGSLRTFRAALR